MTLNVKEAGADAISLSRGKCCFHTHDSASYEIFQVGKKASEMLHCMYILIFLPIFCGNWRKPDFFHVPFFPGLKSKTITFQVPLLVLK